MMLSKTKDNELAQQMLHLVVPITIQQFMLALVSATDALMLGFVDQTSLSAVSLAGQIQFVLNLFVAGIAAGCGIMIAQYWGKRDTASIEKVMPIALYTNLLSSGIFTVLALMIPGGLMRIFTNDPLLIANGASYLRAVALSYVFCGISQIYLILLKNTGHAALSSKISSSAVIINIILNAILIFGLFGAPRLGIVGAAYATVTARLVELVWAYFAVRHTHNVAIRWSGILYTSKVLTKDFWYYTTPALGAALVWGIAFVLYSVILGHMGSDAVAASSIASIVKSMVQCVIRGVSAGAGILVGNLLGANELEKAKNYGGRITRISILIGVVTGTILIILSPFVSHVAPMSDTAREYLQFMMVVLGFNLMGQSVNTTVLDGIFCAGGDAKFDMIGNLGAMWCFSVPLGFITAFVFHAPVWLVYIIISLDEIVKLPAVYKHYKKYVWVRNITR
ncbi:MAG: MATE family efflux transporter [Lachnospiraceae bacterium]